MKATKEALSPTRVKVTIEVPFEELKDDLASAYKRIAGQIRVPGFRPGKVPARIVDQRIGRGYVLNEALPGALDRFYALALQEEQIDAISTPEDVDVKEFSDGEQLVFSAEVDVRPEVELPDLEGLEVTVDDVTVTDEDVEEQLSGLRDRFATLQPVERPVQDGDYITLDLVARINDEVVPGSESKGLTYEVGSGNLIPELDEAIRGASENDERTFDTELKAGDHAGQTAQVTVKLISVKEKELPELDDDFATTASEFDTLDELRADLRERLGRVRRYEQGAQARDRLLEKLNEIVTVPLPESAVKAEVEGREHNLGHQLERFGITKEVYLQTEGKTVEDFDAEQRTESEQAVKSQLLLDAIAQRDEITVEQEELTEHLVRRSQQSGLPPQEFANQIMQAGQLGVLYAEVRRGKALAALMESAKITDGSGNAVDLSRLDDDAEAEAEAEGDDILDAIAVDDETAARVQAEFEDDELEAELEADAAAEAEAEDDLLDAQARAERKPGEEQD